MTDELNTTPESYMELARSAVYRPPGFRVEARRHDPDRWVIIRGGDRAHALGWYATALEAFEAINRGEHDA